MMPESSLEEAIGTIGEERAFVVLAREDFQFYCSYVHADYVPARHTRYICDRLQAIERGEIRKLLVLTPPRHGKSMTVSETFPSWFIGKNPERRVIVVCYGEVLARRFGRYNKSKIQQYGEPLWGITLPMWGGNASQSATDWGIFNHRGGMIARGIGGSITGEGADLLLIDDPIKNREEADSEVYRERLWEEYQNTLRTRLSPVGKVVLIQTRWHEDDLAGRLLQHEKNQWEVVELPCLAEENDILGREVGDPLWPEYGFDKTWAASTRIEVGERTWNSLYQQHPTFALGTKVKRSWWQYYDVLPRVEYMVQSWDTGLKDKKDNDPSCCQTWAKCVDGYYLVGRWKDKVTFPALIQQMKKEYDLYHTAKVPVNEIDIEDAVSGTSALQTLRVETDLPIRGIPVTKSKAFRVDSVSPLIEAGRVFLPRGEEWVTPFLDEWSAFPFAAHDEEVDCTTQALERLRVVSKSFIHTTDEYDTYVTQRIVDNHGVVQFVERTLVRDGNGNGTNGKKDERYSEVQPRLNYFDKPYESYDDQILETCKQQGYVPNACLLTGAKVLDELRMDRDPCSTCNCDRDMCRGRPFGDNRSLVDLAMEA